MSWYEDDSWFLVFREVCKEDERKDPSSGAMKRALVANGDKPRQTRHYSHGTNERKYTRRGRTIRKGIRERYTSKDSDHELEKDRRSEIIVNS